jgi:hypothetical protein
MIVPFVQSAFGGEFMVWHACPITFPEVTEVPPKRAGGRGFSGL